MFVPGQNQLLANLSLLLFLRIFRSFVLWFQKELSRNVFHCSVIKDHFSHCRLSQTALLLYHVVFCLSRSFFNFFWSCFCFSRAATLICYHIQPAVVKNFFHFFFTTFFCQTQLVYIITSLFRCQELFLDFFKKSCGLSPQLLWHFKSLRFNLNFALLTLRSNTHQVSLTVPSHHHGRS